MKKKLAIVLAMALLCILYAAGTSKYPTLNFAAYAIQKADGGADNDGNFTPAEAWAEINK